MIENFKIIIASLPDREYPVAEISYDNVQWAEISQETDDLVIQFYPHPNKKCWEFQLDEAIAVLEMAKKKLLNDQEI